MLLYNTLSRKKEKFQPLRPPKVQMYCCGPTVYGLLHVGNFRGVVVYNLLRLWLEQVGYQVEYHYNLTDIDDKIIAQAKKESLSCEEVSQKYIQEFIKDFNALELKPHEKNPKATDSIQAIISIIEDLIQKEKAYEQDGNVFYRVNSFKKYGRLSNRKIKDLQEGHRVEVIQSKEAVEDFALWKKSKEEEPQWSSPWGKGRPGWHIECTAMIHEGLSSSIDIHGGGMDLIFPHHENEIAQSEALKDEPYVRFWVHHNMFEFEGQKISKSLNSPQTMHSFLKEYNGEIFKYFVLSSHYRSVADYSKHNIHLSIAGLSRVYQSLFLAHQVVKRGEQLQLSPSSHLDKKFLQKIQEARKAMSEALNDDLNSPKAFSHLFDLVRSFNVLFKAYPVHFKQKSLNAFSATAQEVSISRAYIQFFEEWSSVFSLFKKEPQSFLKELDQILLEHSSLKEVEIAQWMLKRDEARKCKNFSQADEIRDQLSQKGVEIQDLKEESCWQMQILDN